MPRPDANLSPSPYGNAVPEHRRELRHRSKEHWLVRARRIGPEVQLAEEIFASDDVLLQLRKVQAVVTHLEKFPVQSAQAAARRALYYGSYDYRSLKNMLLLGLDLLEPLPQDTPTRAWSQGSRCARTPDTGTIDQKELAYARQ